MILAQEKNLRKYTEGHVKMLPDEFFFRTFTEMKRDSSGVLKKSSTHQVFEKLGCQNFVKKNLFFPGAITRVLFSSIEKECLKNYLFGID